MCTASGSLEEYVFRRVTGIVIVLKALALNLFTLQNYVVKMIHLQLVGELAKSEGIAIEFYGVISDLYCCQWQVKWAQYSTDWCSGACISWVCCSALRVQKRSWCTKPVNNHVCKILMNIQWNSYNWWCCHYTAMWIHGNDETLLDVSGNLPQPGCPAPDWRSLCGPYTRSSLNRYVQAAFKNKARQNPNQPCQNVGWIIRWRSLKFASLKTYIDYSLMES